MKVFRFVHTLAVVALVAFIVLPAKAQQAPDQAKKPLIISIFNVGTQLPGSGVAGVFTTPVHPGVCVGTEFRYNKATRNQWFQTAKLGYAHHQYVQSVIQLYTEAGYRRMLWRGIGAEFRLGAGYIHSIQAAEVFKADAAGVYDKKARWGRPQAMAGAALGLSYTLPERDIRLLLDYQFYLQMPFVNEYVTLLPNTALHFGAALPLIP